MNIHLLLLLKLNNKLIIINTCDICLHKFSHFSFLQKPPKTILNVVGIRRVYNGDQGWDSPTIKLYYLSLKLALLQWKTMLVEKTVIVELGESQPWIIVIIIAKIWNLLSSSCVFYLDTKITYWIQKWLV